MEITNKEQFLDTFLERYLERGFGTLSKSEIDMLMMHLLLENSDLRYKPNHEISVALKITETKVKNLKHRASLQFVWTATDLLDKFRLFLDCHRSPRQISPILFA